MSRLFGWDLPPGVSVKDIPGNEPDADTEEAPPRRVDFLAAYENGRWSIQSWPVPADAATTEAAALAWIQRPGGVAHRPQYRRVLLWAVYCLDPEVWQRADDEG